MSKIKPILIIAFNRLNKISNLVNSLNEFNELDIFVSLDGPRNLDDLLKIKNVERKVSELNFNNKLTIKKNSFNLGCSLHCVSAITWFFKQVDDGIIIEDDIKFNKEFLLYCSSNLEKFKYNSNIFGISGSPYISNINKEKFNFLTIYPNIWGWATWRDRWEQYDLTLKNRNILNRFFTLKKYHKSFLKGLYWFFVIELCRSLKINGWDHMIYYQMWKNKSFFLTPSLPLTENIGFDEDGTTMIEKPSWYSIKIDLFVEIPEKQSEISLCRSIKYDKICEKYVYKISFLNLIKLFIKNIFYFPKTNTNDLALNNNQFEE